MPITSKIHRTAPISAPGALALSLALSLALLALLALSPPARADDAKSLGKFGDWEGFSYSDHGAKVCYAATVLKSSDHGPRKRGLAIITVTDRPADRSFGVISVEPGVALKAGTTPSLAIGPAKFDLYVHGRSAWARDDKPVVAAMIKGKIAQFSALPENGSSFVDSYSLVGFDKAKDAIDQACAAKR